MNDNEKKKSLIGIMDGEWKHEKVVYLIAGFACLSYAMIDKGFDLPILINDGAFHSSLLFIIMGYLSDLRYKLRPEVRVG